MNQLPPQLRLPRRHRSSTTVDGRPFAGPTWPPGAGREAASTEACPGGIAGGGIDTDKDRFRMLPDFPSQTGRVPAGAHAGHLVVLSVGQPPTGVDASSTTVPV